jgi:hypothetical protein
MVDIVDLRNLVAEAEGTTDAKASQENFASGYDVPFAYGQYLQPSKPISQMTFKELRDFQRRQVNATKGTFDNTNLGTGAVGRYQFIGPTLENLKNRLGYKDTDVFSPEVQDRLFDALMEEQGLQKLLAGLITPEKFQEKLSSQFASIPKPGTDTGTYKGQNTGVTSDRVSAVLSSMQADTQTDKMLSGEQPGGTFRSEDDTVPSDTGTVTGDQAEKEPGFLDTVGEYAGEAYDTVSEYAGETVNTLERVAESVGEKLRRLLGSEEEQSNTSVDNPPIPEPRPERRPVAVDNPPIPEPRPERRPVAVDNPPIPEPRPKQAAVDFSDVVDFVGTLKKAEGGSVEKKAEFIKKDDDDVPDPPPGATPEEVADDIPAYLSTGEYVLPANVVRYIGLKNITGMHQRALSELQQMEDLDIIENVDENGYVEEDDDEMDYMKPEGVVEIVVAEHHPKGLMAMGFAEGGPVEAMVYVPGVGFVPQIQAATRPSQKKTDEDTRAETREGPSGRGGTDTGKSMSEMSPMEQAAFGGSLSGPLGGAIEAVSKGVVGSALGLGSPLGVERGYSQATGVPTAAQQAMKSVDLDIAKAKEMYAMSPADLAAAQDSWSGPVSNAFGATQQQVRSHAEAVDAGKAPAGSQANAAGGYSTTGEFGFSTNEDGDVVGNDPDKNGIPGDQTDTSTSDAAAEAAEAEAAEAAQAEAAEAAEASGLKRGGYVTRNGIMARGYSEGGDTGDSGDSDNSDVGDHGGGMSEPVEDLEPEDVEEEKPTDPYEGYTYVKGIGYVPTSRRATSNKPIESASLALSSIFTPGFLRTIGIMSDPNEEL